MHLPFQEKCPLCTGVIEVFTGYVQATQSFFYNFPVCFQEKCRLCSMSAIYRFHCISIHNLAINKCGYKRMRHKYLRHKCLRIWVEIAKLNVAECELSN